MADEKREATKSETSSVVRDSNLSDDQLDEINGGIASGVVPSAIADCYLHNPR